RRDHSTNCHRRSFARQANPEKTTYFPLLPGPTMMVRMKAPREAVRHEKRSPRVAGFRFVAIPLLTPLDRLLSSTPFRCRPGMVTTGTRVVSRGGRVCGPGVGLLPVGQAARHGGDRAHAHAIHLAGRNPDHTGGTPSCGGPRPVGRVFAAGPGLAPASGQHP